MGRFAASARSCSMLVALDDAKFVNPCFYDPVNIFDMTPWSHKHERMGLDDAMCLESNDFATKIVKRGERRTE